MRHARHAKDFWATLVAKCDTGETTAVVAMRHGVNERTLRWWRSHLKNGASGKRREPSVPRLLPVVVDDGARGDVQVVVGECRLTFPMDTRIAYVKQLVAVLRSC